MWYWGGGERGEWEELRKEGNARVKEKTAYRERMQKMKGRWEGRGENVQWLGEGGRGKKI